MYRCGSLAVHVFKQKCNRSQTNISTYKISPELNKGAVCFSTTDSSCHLPYDEVLLAAVTACQFYLLHFLTSGRSDFMNSLIQGSTLIKSTLKIYSDTETFSFVNNVNWRFMMWLTSHWPLARCLS